MKNGSGNNTMRVVGARLLVGAAVLAGVLGVAVARAESPSASPRTATAQKKPEAAPTVKKVSPAAAKPAAKAEPAKPAAARSIKSMESVKSWDFSKLDSKKWQWQFPGGAVHPTDGGALYPVREDRPGAVIAGLKAKADDYSAVRVDQHIQRVMKDGRSEGLNFKGLKLYWARSSDVKANPDWPYDDKRAVPFQWQGKEGKETVWVAVVSGHPQWTGQIDRLMIALDVPDENLKSKDEQFNIYAKKFELLK